MKAIVVLLVGIFAWRGVAQADSAAAPAPAASTAYSVSNFSKNIKGTYIMEFSGPTIRTLSGNKDGSGMDLKALHKLALGYKLPAPWSIGLTQPFTQSIDNKSSAQQDPFVAGDPYATISNAEVYSNKKYGIETIAYLRYYMPFSRPTNVGASKASSKDAGNGQVRFYIAPSKSWLDGALSLNLQNLLQYRLAANSSSIRAAKNGNPKHEDLIYVFDPVLSYSINKTVDIYVEYAFEMDHSNDGKWTYWKSQDALDVGANLKLTKRLELNPFLDASPNLDQLKYANIGLNLTYSLL